jgi:hypothetical protein
MVLNAIPTHLLPVTPVADFPEIIRQVPGTLVGLANEGAVASMTELAESGQRTGYRNPRQALVVHGLPPLP